jgi:DNA polymerase III delta' subunit
VRFSDVQHQERALSILRRALRSGRTHHAYLFEGPEGVGKELAARALVARLLCTDGDRAPDADACGACNSCRLLASDNHPDFHLIHRGLHKLHPEPNIRRSKGLFLVVDVIRRFLIEPAGLRPAQGARRVFVLRDAERMNEQAQNALLKTLEEPPGAAVLILVTSSAARLLPTIRSRCQVIPFGYLPSPFVLGELRQRESELSAAEAQALAGLSEGRLGVALRWRRMGLLSVLDDVAASLGDVPAGDPEAFAKRLLETATTLARAARGDSAADDEGEAAGAGDEDDDERDAPRSGKTVPTDELRDGLKLVFLLIGALYRDALLVRAGSSLAALLPQHARFVAEVAARTSATGCEAALDALAEAERMLDRNVAPQLVGERLAVALLGELPVMG